MAQRHGARKSASARPLITLFTPGHRPELFEKARRVAPDTIVIDFEDAVPRDLKASAREKVSRILPALWTRPLIRVNSEPGLTEADLEAVIGPHVYGIILPMAEEVARVRDIARMIARLERDRDLFPGTVRLILLMETALAVRRCFDLVTASDRIESVIFASAEDADLQRDLKCGWSIEGPELGHARARVLLECRAARLPYVLDGAFSDLENDEALRADCRISRRLGYDGRSITHPRHVAVCREVYEAEAAPN